MPSHTVRRWCLSLRFSPSVLSLCHTQFSNSGPSSHSPYPQKLCKFTVILPVESDTCETGVLFIRELLKMGGGGGGEIFVVVRFWSKKATCYLDIPASPLV